MSETEPNERSPDEGGGDDGEDYGAKGSDDREPETRPEQDPIAEAD